MVVRGDHDGLSALMVQSAVVNDPGLKLSKVRC